MDVNATNRNIIARFHKISKTWDGLNWIVGNPKIFIQSIYTKFKNNEDRKT